MSKLTPIIDSFDIPKENVSWNIDEKDSGSVVDGINILGRAVGPFFVTEKSSKNNRYYTKKLWERALNENTDRIDNGEMLGTIGHDQVLDDQALLEGKVSHKVTKLWIDESTGTGMGEIQILSTPAGKVLNSLMRGGVRLKVSSRAMGEFNGKTKDGSNVIDESTFDLKGFDFVQNPGVPSAIPVLLEKFNDADLSTLTNVPTGDIKVNPELFESMMTEKAGLQKTLAEALATNKTITTDNVALQRNFELREREIARLEEALKISEAKASEFETTSKDNSDTVTKIAALGTPEEIEEQLRNFDNTLSEYSKFGTPSELTEAFERVTELVEEFKSLGSPDEIEHAYGILEDYISLGTFDELAEKLSTIKAYESVGTVEQLNKILDVAEGYQELGSPEDITHAFALSESIVSKFQEDARKKEVEDIATSHHVKTEVVEKLLAKYSKDEAIELLESVRENSVSDRYRSPNSRRAALSESTDVDATATAGRKKNDAEAPGVRASKLMESFSFNQEFKNPK